jgi:hypothetical protein
MNSVTPEVSERFAAELVRRGLPVQYAERTAQELADHRRDLVEEFCADGDDPTVAQAKASERLGEMKALVRQTVREYQRRHWCGRRPLLTFLLGPLVLVVANFVAMVLAAYCVFLPLDKFGIRMDQTADGVVSRSEYLVTAVGHIVTLFVGPALSLLILARLARRAAMGSSWLWLSTGVLTLFASSIWYGLAGATMKNLPADQGILRVGLPIWHFAHDPMYIAQCLLPFGIGVGMILRMQQSRRAELSIYGDGQTVDF